MFLKSGWQEHGKDTKKTNKQTNKQTKNPKNPNALNGPVIHLTIDGSV